MTDDANDAARPFIIINEYFHQLRLFAFITGIPTDFYFLSLGGVVKFGPVFTMRIFHLPILHLYLHYILVSVSP